MRALVSLLTLGFFAPVAAGCISNEYVIPRQELHRLTTIPPEVRGEQVHVIQDLGSRRADPIATDGPSWPNAEPWPQPQPQEPPPEQRDTDADLYLHGNVNIYVGPDGRSYGPSGGPRTVGMTPAGGSFRGTPPSGGSISGGGWRGTPTGGGAGGWRGVPPKSSGGGSSGGSGFGNWSGGGGGGGGGGNGGGEALIILAVVVAVVAVVTTVCLVSSEGMRFDGMAQMSPWQPVHLKQRGGGELVIALGDLTPVTLQGVVEGKVMDDEGYGIRKLDHRRLDRRWAPTFKLDFGSLTFSRGDGDVHTGFVGNMQLGLFARSWLGLLLTAGIGGAGDGYGATISRHTFGFELQSLPFALGPLQFGGYANIGAAAIASTATNEAVQWGDAVGGGLLSEVQVTSRMALTLRAGANAAFFADSGMTSPAATITAGLAIY